MADRKFLTLDANNANAEASGIYFNDSTNELRTRPTGTNTGGGSIVARHLYAGGSAGGFHIENTSGTNDFSIMPDASPAANIIFECNGDTIQWGSVEIATGNFTLQQALLLSNAITPAALSAGNNNDWAPTGFATCFAIRATAVVSSAITGLAGGAEGRIVVIESVGTGLTIKHEDTNSVAANRFAMANDLSLAQDEAILLRYDAIASRWRPIGIYKDITSIQASIASLGTAAFLNVPASGNAAAGEVVKGNDTRLGIGNHLIVPIFSGSVSAKTDSGAKRRVGDIYFDPTDTSWGTSGTSTIKLFMLLEVTNASFTAHGELYQETGTGSPGIIAATGTTSATTPTLVSVDISTAFRPAAGHAGNYAARIWVSTADGTNQVTCSGAWIDIVP